MTEDLLSIECKFEFLIENGRPQALIYGSSIQLAIAVHTILEAEGNFYKNLRLVIAFHEMQECGFI